MRRAFTSLLAHDLEAFLDFKRAMGHRYQNGEFTLRRFDRYVQHSCDNDSSLSMEQLVRGWLSQATGTRKASTIANELGVIRKFCLFLRRRNPRGFVPGREWAPQSTKSHFLPYIFSPQEVRKLLVLTQSLRGPQFRKFVFRTLILILYCTGLRFGEALRLRLTDVDLKQRLLWIRESKGKTRLVPFRRDLAQELQKYLQQRSRIASDIADGPFLIRPNGKAFTTGHASEVIRALLRRAGMKPARGRIGPRPYDLRHAFAVHRLTRWYRAGVDIHQRLPWLSAYMGHNNIVGTEIYLHSTSELLAMAADRFERRAALSKEK